MFTFDWAIKGQSVRDVGTHDRRRTKKKKHLTKESSNKLKVYRFPQTCNHCSLKPQLSI